MWLEVTSWSPQGAAYADVYAAGSACYCTALSDCQTRNALWASYRLPGVPGVGKRRAELRNPTPCRHSAERTSSGRTHGPKERDWDTAPHFSPPHLTASCRGRGHLQGGERLGEEKQRSREFIHFFLLCLPPPALLAAGGSPLSLERIQLPLQATQQREDIRGLETGFAI